jgi:hypothetical protein
MYLADSWTPLAALSLGRYLHRTTPVHKKPRQTSMPLWDSSPRSQCLRGLRHFISSLTSRGWWSINQMHFIFGNVQELEYRTSLWKYTGCLKKEALLWYSKRYYEATVTKPVTLKGVQTIHRLYAFKCKGFQNTPHSNIWNSIAKLFLKHSALPVEVTLNHNYPS